MDKTKFVKITYRDDLSGYVINKLGQLKNIKTGSILKGTIDRNGYLRYTVILDDGRRAVMPAHLLVANEFIPIVAGKTCINHIDEDKMNSDVDNLEWCSYKENANHATCQMRRSKNRKKPVNEYAITGKYIRTWKSAQEVEKFFSECVGVEVKAVNAIQKAVCRKQCLALGRVWRYYDGNTENIVVKGVDLPQRSYWRKEWGIFDQIKDVPNRYLHQTAAATDTLTYFLQSPKLSGKEKNMLKEAFGQLEKKNA